ncbi:MAG TPA: DMT family transporter [Dongiaceae bacterium]|nr:DMT family transporter [Dongiaceae bacterium]
MQSLAASLAVAACGSLWGIYWLPLRHLEQAGLSGGWQTAAFFLAAFPPAVSLTILARAEIRRQFRDFLWLALLNGLVFNLYSNAYAHTTVFNVLFLFYLSPVWSILIARIWYRQRVSLVRIGCVVGGLSGLVIMLSGDGGLPLPRNLGDWMALVSGILWAVLTIRIRNSHEIGSTANLAAFLIGGLIFALLFALIGGGNALPSVEAIGNSWLLVLVIAWIGWLPSQFILFWGVRRISPVRTSILLMTELVSGVATAAWLSGDPVTWQQLLGGGLIVAAGLGDVLAGREKQAPAPMPLTVTQE